MHTYEHEHENMAAWSHIYRSQDVWALLREFLPITHLPRPYVLLPMPLPRRKCPQKHYSVLGWQLFSHGRMNIKRSPLLRRTTVQNCTLSEKWWAIVLYISQEELGTPLSLWYLADNWAWIKMITRSKSLQEIPFLFVMAVGLLISLTDGQEGEKCAV